jgi:enoyl-CoA hydratase/carnithine racemase
MKPVRFERHDSVGHIVLANPPLNLIASEFSERLSEAIQEASESDIRALLIRAEGPNFSQGGDILDFIDKEFNAWRTFISDMHHSYRKIEALQIPTVCAVRGRAWAARSNLPLPAT